jgi:hypothetical protein
LRGLLHEYDRTSATPGDGMRFDLSPENSSRFG